MWHCASLVYNLTTWAETELLSSHQSHALSKVFFVSLWFVGWVYTKINQTYKIRWHTNLCCIKACYGALWVQSASVLTAMLFWWEFWNFLLFQWSVYICLLNIYWSVFTIPNFPSQLQPISACVILQVSETDPAVCYHKNSWPSNMHIPTSANLNMKTHRDFQTSPLIWLSKKRYIKARRFFSTAYMELTLQYLYLESCVFTHSF